MKKAKRNFVVQYVGGWVLNQMQQLTLDQQSELFIKHPKFRKYFWLMSCVNVLLDTSKRKKLN